MGGGREHHAGADRDALGWSGREREEGRVGPEPLLGFLRKEWARQGDDTEED